MTAQGRVRLDEASSPNSADRCARGGVFGWRAGLSDPRGQDHRSVPGRWLGRRRATHRGRGLSRNGGTRSSSRTARRGGNMAPSCLQGGARRLYAYVCAAAAAGCQPESLSAAQFRSHSIREDRGAGAHSERAGGHTQVPGQDGGGDDLLCQGESRQDQFGNAGQRLDFASHVGDVPDDCGCAVPACALYRHCAGSQRSRRRQCRHHVRQSRRLACAGERRQAAPLAVASRKRMALLPNVPTFAETLPGFSSEAFFAVVAPPKTPAAIVNKINADINEALRQPSSRRVSRRSRPRPSAARRRRPPTICRPRSSAGTR